MAVPLSEMEEVCARLPEHWTQENHLTSTVSTVLTCPPQINNLSTQILLPESER